VAASFKSDRCTFSAFNEFFAFSHRFKRFSADGSSLINYHGQCEEKSLYEFCLAVLWQIVHKFWRNEKKTIEKCLAGEHLTLYIVTIFTFNSHTHLSTQSSASWEEESSKRETTRAT